MTKPKCLDLFSKAGGTSMGYYRAGFDVTGVDIQPQKRFPFKFIQADALEYLEAHWQEYDFIAASPPCQGYSVTRSLTKKQYPMLIEAVRHLLNSIGKPYAIENVLGAPLVNPLLLCGSMFPGLKVYRHRLFETNPPIYWPPAPCNHIYSMPASKGEYHTLEKKDFITCVGHNFKAADGRIAMGIDWMTRAELAEAIPPAYTEFIGRQIIELI